MTELARSRVEEQRLRELEWPQHEVLGDEAVLFTRPSLAVPAVRRFLFLSSLSMLAFVIFLSHDEGSAGPNGFEVASLSDVDDISDQQAESYLAELGLRGARRGAAPAPPWSALPSAVSAPPSTIAVDATSDSVPRDGWLQDDALLPEVLPPDSNPGQPVDGGSRGEYPYEHSWGDGNGVAEATWRTYRPRFGDDAIQPSASPPVTVHTRAAGVILQSAETEAALLHLIDASRCTDSGGHDAGVRACDLAKQVLRHIRAMREAIRERYAEQEAGEAVGRLMRAFVLLCILRLVIAQQQRRRLTLERRLAAWDRQALPV